MNARAASLSALACVLLGMCLPSLWLPRDEAGRASAIPERIGQEKNPPPAAADWRAALRNPRSPMAVYQSICDDLAERADHGIMEDGGADYPYCAEAEELALYFTAEAAGRRAKDGPALFKFLEEILNDDASTIALCAWAEASPEAALAAMVERGASGKPGVSGALKILASKNPDKVLALLKAVPFNSSDQGAWNAVLAGCAERGAELGLEVIRAAPKNLRWLGMATLTQTLAAKDPRAALQWFDNLPPDVAKSASLHDVFSVWAQQDPAAAFQEWTARNPLDSSGWELARLWAAKDPDALLRWGLEHPDAADGAFGAAIQAVVHRDPQRALRMLEQTPAAIRDPQSLRTLLRQAGESWVASDTAAALTWARSLPPDQRSYVMAGMFPEIWGLPPEERRAVAADIGVDTPFGFHVLMQVDRAEAENVLAALPPEAARSLCWDMAAMSDSPADAARFLDAFLRSSGEPSSTPLSYNDSDPGAPAVLNKVSGLAVRWAAEDPVAAAAWVDRMAPDSFQTAAAANLVYTWGRYDLPAARAWVEQLTAGAARDKAAEQITRLTKLSGE